MSIRSSFFTSQAGDRVYDASDFARRFKDIIRDGVVVDGGGVLTTQNQVTVVGGNMQTRVNLGKSIVQGYTVEVYTAQEVVTHATADALNPRIDRVVVEISVTSGRIGAIKIVQGTPAASPVAPSLTRNSDVYQLSLARVLIGTGVTVLTNGNITDERPDPALCGLANVTIGITPPTGNSAVTVTVDNTNFTVITGTNQQTVNDSIDDTFVTQQSAINAKANLVGGNTFTGDQTITEGVVQQKISGGTANKRWFRWDLASPSYILKAINDGGSVVRSLVEFFHDGGMRIFGNLFLNSGATMANDYPYWGLTTVGVAKVIGAVGADDKVNLGDASIPTVIKGTNVTGNFFNQGIAQFMNANCDTLPINEDPNNFNYGYKISNHINRPEAGENGFWHYITFGYGSERTQIALLYGNTKSKMYTRSHYDGIWSAWYQVSVGDAELLSITTGFSGTYTGYMKLRKASNKLVVFNMDIFSGAGNVNLIYTLPVGYRPVETITMPVVRVGSVSGYITIGTDGTVNISAVANAVDIKGSIAYYVA